MQRYPLKPTVVVPQPPLMSNLNLRNASFDSSPRRPLRLTPTRSSLLYPDQPPRKRNRCQKCMARFCAPISSHIFIRTRYAVAIVLMGASFLSNYHSHTFVLADHYIEMDDKDFFTWLKRLDVKLSFFVARLLLLLPAARFSELYGAKWLLFTASLAYALTSLFIPAFVGINNKPYFLIAGLIHSLMSGVVVPSLHVILSRWAPPVERFAMGSLVNSGFPFGTSASAFIIAWLSSTVGWEYAYYFAALLSLIWLVTAAIFIRDFPQEHRYMCHREQLFVVKCLKRQLYKYELRRKSRLPFKAMFSSAGVWAFIVNNVAFSFADYLFQDSRRRFSEKFAQDNVMHPVNQAVVFAYPYHWRGVTTLLFGMYCYIAIKRDIFTKLTTYKVGNLIGILSVLINLPLDYIEMPLLEVIATPVFMVLMAGFLSTSSLNHFDLAPNYCGTLIAVATTLGHVPVIILWRWETFDDSRLICYGTVGILSLLTAIMYTVSVRADPEPWNNYSNLIADT